MVRGRKEIALTLYQTNTLVAIPPTRRELNQLASLRLAALAHVAELLTLDGIVPPSERHGWKAYIRPLRRTVEGDLLAEIHVTTPALVAPYVRRVRLVKKQTLPL